MHRERAALFQAWWWGGRDLGRLAAFALLATLVMLRVADPVELETLRLKTFDTYQRIKPHVPHEAHVLIVDVDEQSLAVEGQWPWPRTRLATLIEKITAQGAKAIAIDSLFPEPDRMSPALLARSLKLKGAARTELEALPSNDQVFADALRRSVVAVAQAGQSAPSAELLGPPAPQTPIAVLGGSLDGLLVEFPGLLRNQPVIEAAAQGRGLSTFRPDSDNIVRRVAGVLKADHQIVPSLAIELLRLGARADTILVKRDQAGVRSIVFGQTEIATDNTAQLWLHHAYHRPEIFVSAQAVLAGTTPVDLMRDKLVIVGSSAVGLFDLRSTPLEPIMPGVELHAQVIENVLGGALLTRPNYALGVEIFIATVIGAAVIVLVPMLGALPVLLLGASTAVVLGASSWVLFSAYGVLIDVVYPLLSCSLVFALLVGRNYLREEAARSSIRAAFSRYLSPDLVDRLAKSPDRLVLGGETREMTLLFSDVRGFTALSEGYKGDPQGLIRLINALLTPVSNAILAQRGTIDKYMGDAVLAFWNAPLDDPLHVSHACAAALDIQNRLDGLNNERKRAALAAGVPYQPIEMGIGINTGMCVVGNMGSEVRFDYSVLGDSVNVASRIEGLTRVYGVSILAGEETGRRLSDEVAAFAIDHIRVRGKSNPELIYAIIGGADVAGAPWFTAFRRAFRDLRASCDAGDWSAAHAHLARASDSVPDARLAVLIDHYADRIARDAGGSVAAASDGKPVT